MGNSCILHVLIISHADWIAFSSNIQCLHVHYQKYDHVSSITAAVARKLIELVVTD